MNTHDCDVMIIGGGPAGLAAGVAVQQSGKRVLIVDDNPRLGGQIWRGRFHDKPARQWLNQAGDVPRLVGAKIFSELPPVGNLRRFVAETSDDICTITSTKVILATGARERFLPFPGWTSPGVMGVGGLQAMVKSRLPIKGKWIILAGTGPLLLAVASYLHTYRANILLIAEQAPFSRLARFGAALIEQPGKIAQGIGFAWNLLGVKFQTSSWVTGVKTTGHGLQVRIQHADSSHEAFYDCDYLACAYHLVPNSESALMFHCAVEDGCIKVDEFQRTSRPEIYAAGECTGIGGVERSLIEGQIAGFAAAGKEDQAQKLFPTRAKYQRFADRLNHTFALRDELRDLPTTDTIVCRCEDVTWGALAPYQDWRSAKLQTRCGMGPCQGRICGGALSFYRSWHNDSVRPPAFPVRVESLAQVNLESSSADKEGDLHQ